MSNPHDFTILSYQIIFELLLFNDNFFVTMSGNAVVIHLFIQLLNVSHKQSILLSSLKF